MTAMCAASVQRAVTDYMTLRDQHEVDRCAATRLRADRAFSRLHRIMVLRLGRAIGNGRYHDAMDDAGQALAIGLHKAIGTYDPSRAQFVTHATWAIRAELKTLGWQLHVDQRPCNRDRGVRTVSGHAATGSGDESAELFDRLADEGAEVAVERAASDTMTSRMLSLLIARRHAVELAEHQVAWLERHVAPNHIGVRQRQLFADQARDAELVQAHVLGQQDSRELAQATGLTARQVEQIIDEYLDPTRSASRAAVFSRQTRVAAIEPSTSQPRQPHRWRTGGNHTRLVPRASASPAG